jgi:hypothetical protein
MEGVTVGVFGALSLDSRQLFRQYKYFDGEMFRDFLRLVHYKFPQCYLFLDKARQHGREFELTGADSLRRTVCGGRLLSA